MSENKLATYLAENPRMTGGLFTLMLVLSQAGSVAARCSGNAGP
jgi:hypothetical protein